MRVVETALNSERFLQILLRLPYLCATCSALRCSGTVVKFDFVIVPEKQEPHVSEMVEIPRFSSVRKRRQREAQCRRYKELREGEPSKGTLSTLEFSVRASDLLRKLLCTYGAAHDPPMTRT